MSDAYITHMNSILNELEEANFFSKTKDITDVKWIDTGINLLHIRHEYFLKSIKLMCIPALVTLVVKDFKVIKVEAMSVDNDGNLRLAVDPNTTDFEINNCNYHVSHSNFSSGKFGAETTTVMYIQFFAR